VTDPTDAEALAAYNAARVGAAADSLGAIDPSDSALRTGTPASPTLKDYSAEVGHALLRLTKERDEALNCLAASDNLLAGARARLAALEPVARQLYNAGSETLSAIETVVGCEVGTLNENDLCAKPLLKALDAYRAVDALRETEK
jgi:hypothetical protein